MPRDSGGQRTFGPTTRQAAGTLFVAPDGDVLLLRRSGAGDHKGEWCLPGGMVEADETAAEAAAREAKEEIGAVPDGKRRLLDQRTNGVAFTTFAQAVPEKFTPTLNGEHTGYAWAGLHELPQPLHPGLRDMLEDQLGRERSAEDMSPNDWDGLVKGFLKWIDEEETEQEHAEDDAAGKLSEKERAEADRTAKERTEMPGEAFLEAASRKYPVKVKKDGAWAYSRDLLLAAAREARMHGHEDLAKRADTIRAEEFGGAQDAALIAFDRESVRNYDADGRLHVERTPISKANICEYYGREIPMGEQLGLAPDRKYRLLRHPDELRRAADTFNNLPLLRRHVPVNAMNHQPDEVIGSTGTDAGYEEPYLMNSLVVWTKDDIEDIENDLRKELSSAYRYRADMTPGSFEGEPYDGVMRDLVGNHVALVKEGRAGPDVVVGDEKPKESHMPKTVLTRKAIQIQGALTAFLAPRLAADAKIDVSPLLADIDQKNYPKRRAAIEAGVAQLAAGRLAKDAKLDGLGPVLMALDAVEAAEAEDEEEESEEDRKKREAPEARDKAKDRKASDRKGRDSAEELKERLKGKLSADEYKAACDDIDGMMSEDEDDDGDEDDKKKPVEAKDRKGKDAEPEPMTKKAMDEAIAGERQRQRDVREAERFVRGWVGDLAIAYDSAEDVYKAALEARGKSTKGIHPSAYRALLEMLPKPGTEHRQPSARLGMDARGGNTTSFEQMYGSDATRIRLS